MYQENEVSLRYEKIILVEKMNYSEKMKEIRNENNILQKEITFIIGNDSLSGI